MMLSRATLAFRLLAMVLLSPLVAASAESAPDYLSFATDDEANTTEVFQKASPAVVFVTSSELRRQRLHATLWKYHAERAPVSYGMPLRA